MSDLQDLIHTNARLAYEQGVKTERERILHLIAIAFPSRPNDTVEQVIELIKGEQND